MLENYQSLNGATVNGITQSRAFHICSADKGKSLVDLVFNHHRNLLYMDFKLTIPWLENATFPILQQEVADSHLL